MTVSPFIPPGWSERLARICFQVSCVKVWGPMLWGAHGDHGRGREIIFLLLTSWGKEVYCWCFSCIIQTSFCCPYWRLHGNGWWGWLQWFLVYLWSWWRLCWSTDSMATLVTHLVGWDLVSFWILYTSLFASCETWMFPWSYGGASSSAHSCSSTRWIRLYWYPEGWFVWQGWRGWHVTSLKYLALSLLPMHWVLQS